MTLVRSLTAIALISLSGLAAAHPVRPPVATPHERAEVRHDRREIARDRYALMHTRAELARAERAHDFRRASQLRRELYRQRVALRHDRVEYRHDVRDLHSR